MNILATIAVLIVCCLLMGAGFILKRKVLKRGCSLGDDCTCTNEPPKSNPESCEHKQPHNS